MKTIILSTLLCCLSVTSCTTLPDGTSQFDPKKAEAIAGTVVLQALLSMAQTKFSGGDIDKAWAMSAAMNSISTVVKSLDNQQAAALIQGTSMQFANGDPKFASVTTNLAKTYVAANPQTEAQKTAAVLALSTGISAGTQKAVNAVP